MKIEASCDTELQRVFAALTWVDVHDLPWAWCVKRIPSRTRCWLLHHLFRVGFRLAWIYIASRRLTGATRARQSLAGAAIVALLRVISRLYARRVLGNVERYRQSVLRIISPTTSSDLLALAALEPIAASVRPDFVWIAHRAQRPSACRRVLFYVHGGGFAKGDLAAFHHACAAFAAALHGLLAFPLYGLCPEQTLAGAVCELVSAYRRVRERFRAAEIVLMADSAGGLLADRLLLRLRKTEIQAPAAVVLLSPLLDVNLTAPSLAENQSRDPLVDVDLLTWLCALAREHAGPDSLDWTWDRLDYFPPTYVVASQDEVLRDDSQRLESALLSSGVPTRTVFWPGLCHAFPLLHDYLPESAAALAAIRAWLDELPESESVARDGLPGSF